MSVTGVFLLLFILVHLTVNLLLIMDDTGNLYNQGAHFMVSNPLIRVVEPLLALGFVIHIAWSLLISWENWRARPVKYKKQELAASSGWASRNMLILGALVLVFLVIHLVNFYWKIKFTGSPLLEKGMEETGVHNTYALVSTLFRESWFYCVLYIAGAVLLGLHITHGFWSAFQTLGFNNKRWLNRLQQVALVYAIAVGAGFTIIPLYFMFFLP